MQRSTSLTLLLILAAFQVALAQDSDAIPEMITDRPDATESPSTVLKGTLQVETGAFFESFEKNDIKTELFAYNTTLLRIGVLDNFEFRLGWNFEEIRTTVDGERLDQVESGLSPLLAGMKVAIAKEKGLLPEIGLLGHVYLPFTASTDFRPEYTGADFRFSFAHTLSEKTSIAYNIGAQWIDDSPEAAYVYTLVLGHSLTNSLGLYAELYGDLPEDSRANHLWDAGITYLLQPNIQLDLTVGSSITEGQDLLVSGGISFRIPK